MDERCLSPFSLPFSLKLGLVIAFQLVKQCLCPINTSANADFTLRPALKYGSFSEKGKSESMFDKAFSATDKKKPSAILEELKRLDSIISGNENEASELIKSFHGREFLALLNAYISSAKNDPLLGDIRTEAIGIFKKIMGNPGLSGVLSDQMTLYDTTPANGISFNYLDGEEGESARFLQNSFPALLNILKDPEKVQTLILFLSFCRLAYYKDEEAGYNKDEDSQKDTLFEYALKNGIYVQIGDNLFVTPISGSFRRHVVFTKNVHGGVKDAVEIMIIGDQEFRESLGTERIDVYKDMCQLFGDRFSSTSGSIKPHLLVEYPKKIIPKIDAYGKVITFKHKSPFRVIIHDYSRDSQGRRLSNINSAFLKRISDETGIELTAEDLMEQFFTLVNRFMIAGYYFNSDGYTDLTTHNFTLCLDGKLKPSNDYGTFYKPKGTKIHSGMNVMDIFNNIGRETRRRKRPVIPSWAVMKWQLGLVLKSIRVEPRDFSFYPIIKRVAVTSAEEEQFVKSVSNSGTEERAGFKLHRTIADLLKTGFARTAN